MKKLTQILLVVGFLGLSNQLIAQEHIRLTNGEWPPFTSEKLERFGAVSHIVTEAFAREDITVDYGFFPWKRAYKLAETGSWDGTIVWGYSAERAQHFYFSDPVLISQDVLFHLKDTPLDWGAIDDLNTIKIGASIGYYYGQEFEEAEQSGMIAVERVFDDEMALRMVLKGRLDACVVNRHVGYELLRQKFSPEALEKMTHHPDPVREAIYHVLLSKKLEKSTTLIQLFNSGLYQLTEDGLYDRYLQDALEGKYLPIK